MNESCEAISKIGAGCIMVTRELLSEKQCRSYMYPQSSCNNVARRVFRLNENNTNQTRCTIIQGTCRVLQALRTVV